MWICKDAGNSSRNPQNLPIEPATSGKTLGDCRIGAPGASHCDQVGGALVEEHQGDALAEYDSISRSCRVKGSNLLRAVATEHDSIEEQPAALDPSPSSDRGQTAGTQGEQQRPLGDNGLMGGGVVEWGQDRPRRFVVHAGFDAERSLANRRQH
jgi:hypothetical protein